MKLTAKPVILVPPQPNLGPEPFKEPALVWPWFIAIFGVVITVALFRLRKPRTGRSQTAGSAMADVATPVPSVERMAMLSAEVRRSLALRFDETWLAKTTEEISANAALNDRLGTDGATRLVDFLRAADLARFARKEGQGVEFEAWLDWATAFVAAGASSKRIGK